METAMDVSNSDTTNVHITSGVKEEDTLHCFVCDMVITGSSKFYSLATCRAQKSRSRIIEKLGQLVGDQYMVVIAEDDIICRGCATVVNTLDRLECEMGSLRGVILRFLEKKYALPEGELVNQKTTGMSQPPQIMPSSKPGRGNLPLSSMARKRQAALQQLGISDVTDIQQENINHLNKSKDGPDKWIQCDKCKYTTKYSSFKYHHLRGAEECELAEQEMEKTTPVKKVIIPPRKVGRPPKNRQIAQPTTVIMEELAHDSDDSETVEMIAAEINDYTASQIAGQENMISVIPTSVTTKEPETIKVQIVSQGQASRKRYIASSGLESGKEVTIEMPEMTDDSVESEHVEVITDDSDQICVMESVDEQMMKINEDDEDNTVYVRMVEVGKEEGDEETTSSKQVLAVSDDGTVEMVEVTWDEMHAAETAAHESATF